MRRIVTALGRAGGPLTIPELLAADGRLVQSSTYRNLAVLEEAGVASGIVTPLDHARFELDERVTDRHHHHLICVECGEIWDFELPPTVEQSLEREFDRAGRAAAFRIDRHRVDLLGTCASCT